MRSSRGELCQSGTVKCVIDWRSGGTTYLSPRKTLLALGGVAGKSLFSRVMSGLL